MRRLLIATILTAAVALPAIAHQGRSGDLTIDEAWTRAVAPGASTAVGYMVIRNAGETADRLVGAETPAARAVEMHATTTTDGIIRMRPLAGGIPIPARQSTELSPGGVHLMLLDPRDGFTRGGRIPVTLVFERAGRVTIELDVEAPGARAHRGH
jgi:copper(I)-binding protein